MNRFVIAMPIAGKRSGTDEHRLLVVAYHALHKVYSYFAECDSELVAVNLFSLAKRQGSSHLELIRLAQTGRGANYPLNRETGSNQETEDEPPNVAEAADAPLFGKSDAKKRKDGPPSVAEAAAVLQSRLGFYVTPSGDSFKLGVTDSEEPNGIKALKEYGCAMLMFGEGFVIEKKMDEETVNEVYSLVVVSRCKSSMIQCRPAGYWLKGHVRSAQKKVPLAKDAEAHFKAAIEYLKWALPNADHNPSTSDEVSRAELPSIKAWTRLPLTSITTPAKKPDATQLIKQVTQKNSKYAAVLFADIRGFTNLTIELQKHPELADNSVARFLSPGYSRLLDKWRFRTGYFEIAHKVISRHGGQLDKFIGDGVMGVFFGDNPTKPTIDPDRFADFRESLREKMQLGRESNPFSSMAEMARPDGDEDDGCESLRQYYRSRECLGEAVKCGLTLVALFKLFWEHAWSKDISHALSKKSNDFEMELKNVSLGVGICGGKLMAGFFGSRWQDQFTVLGDTVNRAARMEGQAHKFDDKRKHRGFGLRSVPKTGEVMTPDLIIQIPTSTIFADILKSFYRNTGTTKFAKFFADDLKEHLLEVTEETFDPIETLKNSFLEDECSDLLVEHKGLKFKRELKSMRVSTDKHTKVRGTEPAVGIYVDLVS